MKWSFIFILSGALIFMSYRKAEARGYRNNNPGNIKKTNDKWQGLAPVQDDPIFFKFVSPEYGIRAIGIIIKNYMRLHGLYSIRGIISRWSATDQEAYIAYVSKMMNVPPDQPIGENFIPAIVNGIILFENGYKKYDVATVNKGLELAGLVV